MSLKSMLELCRCAKERAGEGAAALNLPWQEHQRRIVTKLQQVFVNADTSLLRRNIVNLLDNGTMPISHQVAG